MASGFAGLAYEVVWTRMLAVVLGTEMAAMLGVVTGFFAGLGLGALLLDRLIRRARRPQRAYAWLELAIAAWAVASIGLLPWAGSAARALLGTTPSHAALWAAGFVLPTLVLLPATLAMGGTLVALERLTAAMLPATPGARVPRPVAAGVYGANTAGAMAGALVSVLVLLPALGVSGTMLALAAVNLACALLALSLRPAVRAQEAVEPVEAETSELSDGRLTCLLVGTGVLGIAFEVLVIRLAAQVLQDTIYTFALLLAAFLLGTAAGGLAWQRGRRPPGRTAVSWLLIAAAGTVLLTTLVLRSPWLQAWRGQGAGWLAEAAVAMALFGPPAMAGGALFGCLAQAVRDRRGTLGGAVGLNALGAAVAPALASLVLIPALGSAPALLVVAAGYLLLGPVPGRRAALAAGAVGLAGLTLWLVPGPAAVQIPPGGRLLALNEGPTATAGVVEDAGGVRFLEVNGHFRMGGTSSRRSDWRQAQLPLLLHPAPQRALFLGVGTGATLAGAAAMPGLRVTGVELTPEVVALLPWFSEPGQPAAPRVVTADARRFVAADRQAYDVVVADLFHPALDGTGSLYTVEHFTAVRDRLAPGGLFAQWLPLYQLDQPSLAAIIRSFVAVYPDASAWLAHYSLQTPMLLLLGGTGAGPQDWTGLARRLAAPGVERGGAVTGLRAPLDVLGLYVGSAPALAAFAGAGPANTDDQPFVTLDARRNVRALSAPPADLLLTVLRGTAPGRESPGLAADPSQAARLRAYWRARDRFILAGAMLPEGLSGHALIDAAVPGLLDTLRLSPEFDPAYKPVLGMAQALLGPGQPLADREEGVALLLALPAAAPGRPEARQMLELAGPP
ncbi:MAG: fused MFS/spermidine synthase [Janthinobacterium lividum]